VHDIAVSSHDNSRSKFVSLRLSYKLSRDLKTVADKECNTQSAVIRRILSAGLSRELTTNAERKR